MRGGGGGSYDGSSGGGQFSVGGELPECGPRFEGSTRWSPLRSGAL